MVIVAYPGERHEDITPVKLFDFESDAVAWIGYQLKETVVIAPDGFWISERHNFLHKPVLFESDRSATEYIIVAEG